MKKKLYLCTIFLLIRFWLPLFFEKMSANSYISQLSAVLFWDLDREHLDAERYSAGLIQRVLEYGTLQDWRLTRDYYGMDRIVAECKRLRTLDPMALSSVLHWHCSTDIACLWIWISSARYLRIKIC